MASPTLVTRSILRVTKRADRNAPATTVDANAPANRIIEERLRRTNDSATWTNWTCAPPTIITSLDISLFTTARQKELFWSSVLRTDHPIGPAYGSESGRAGRRC